MPFSCSICGEESTQICARCTKDACDNHLCEKFCEQRFCECEVRLSHRARGDPRCPARSGREAILTLKCPEPVIPGPDLIPAHPVPEKTLALSPRLDYQKQKKGVSRGGAERAKKNLISTRLAVVCAGAYTAP
jgi:hypothetical protein